MNALQFSNIIVDTEISPLHRSSTHKCTRIHSFQIQNFFFRFLMLIFTEQKLIRIVDFEFADEFQVFSVSFIQTVAYNSPHTTTTTAKQRIC